MKKPPLLKAPVKQVLKTLLIMKFIVTLLFASVLQASANEGRTQETIYVEFNRTKLSKALKEIEKSSRYRFVYSSHVLNGKERVTISARRGSVADVLKSMLLNTNLTFERIDSNLFVIKNENRIRTFIPIKGKVVNAKGEPLTGVSVATKDGAGTTTNAAGEYTIEAVEGEVLTFSYVGYAPQKISVGKESAINVTLEEANVSELQEVVVTALGVKREEKSLSYATQRVKGESVATVKGVDLATSLTGKVAGLLVRNTTEFYESQSVSLRGQSPLIVVDGVMGSPVGSFGLRDVPVDIIETIDVLKGSAASALYGANAQGGVIMITTKRGKTADMSIEINSNTMVQAGFLAIPKVQSSYAHGLNGVTYNDYVWGPKLDIGKIESQWNPVTKQYDNMPLTSKGKDNLKNFIETGLVTNNTLSISQGNERTNFRATFNHIYNKGQFPNQKFNIYSANISGEMKSVNGRFQLRSNMGFTKKAAPQIWGNGYDDQGYLYNLVMWTGPEYDLRQYKDYWKVPYQSQNWLYDNWYDNPYLTAYEKLLGVQENIFNYSMTMNYKLTKKLNLLVRPGFDMYANQQTQRNPIAPIFSTRGGWNGKGLYGIAKNNRWSTNNDAILTYNESIKDFSIDVMAGGSIGYWVYDELGARTSNGLQSPTFYSLRGSNEPVTVSPNHSERQINSAFARASVGWRNALFLEATGRNDWISTQPKDKNSNFYPSVGSSVVLSELVRLPKVIDMLKVRGSWAKSKSYNAPYEINRTYSVTQSAWIGAGGSLNSSSYPSNLLGSADLLPTSFRDWEIGLAGYALKKRLHFDVAFFNRLTYDRQVNQAISNASGFSQTRVNTKETLVRKGFEITIDGDIIKNKNFTWNAMINWANQKQFFKELDSVYSEKAPWVHAGGRTDFVRSSYWMRDSSGNVIHVNGMPQNSQYSKHYGYSNPDFVFGIINNFTLFERFIISLSMDGIFGGVLYNYMYDKQFDTGTSPETDNQFRYDEVVNGLTNYVGNGVKVVSGQVTFDNFGQVISDTRKYAPNDIPVGYQRYARSFRGGDKGYQKTTFLKVREFSIGYSFDKKVFGKSGIKSASVSLTAQNLLLFTKFKNSDPDLGAEDLNSPSQRVLGINFKVGF